MEFGLHTHSPVIPHKNQIKSQIIKIIHPYLHSMHSANIASTDDQWISRNSEILKWFHQHRAAGDDSLPLDTGTEILQNLNSIFHRRIVIRWGNKRVLLPKR